MIEIKREPILALVYLAALAAAVYLVSTGKATVREVAIFFTGSALVPAVAHRKRSPSPVNAKKNAAPASPPIPVTVDDESAPTSVDALPKDEKKDA